MTFRGLTSSFTLAFPQRPRPQSGGGYKISESYLIASWLPLTSSVASADSVEKMNLGPMDFPVSHSGGGRRSEKGEQQSLWWSFPFLPEQRLHKRREPGASPAVT